MNDLNKGLFLTEFYGVKDLPELVDEQGNPTKFAEAASYWGEEIPTTVTDIKRLVAKGAALQATQNFSQSQKLSYNAVYGGKQELSLVRPNRIKVPFVKTGAWKHDVYGEVKFTEDDIQQLVDNYKKGVTGFTPYLTLGHLDEEPESTDSHRKRGDLQDVVIEDNVAYGIFDVNPDLYEAVQKGEYEYSSGEFNRQFTAKETGEKVGTAVIRVALTNSPFLPFGDSKVQALSDNAESCPENNESYVFLLSIDANKSLDTSEPSGESEEEPSVESSAEPQETTTINSNKETTMSKTQVTNPEDNNQVVTAPAEGQEVAGENVNKVIAEESKTVEPTTIEPEVKSEPVKAEVTPNVAEVAISNLTSQLAKVEELYKSQLEAANKTIEALSSKLDSLTTKLAGQEQVTQAFSTSMSQAQERALVNRLQDGGLLPASVQKFLAFKKAFEASENKNIVKFSQTVGEETKEVEYDVVDAVSQLLLSVSAQPPLVEQQLGLSSGRVTGAFNFNNIIERNKQAASK